MRKLLTSLTHLVACAFFLTLSPTVEADTNLSDEPPWISGGLAWSPDGNTLAVGTSNGVWLHDATQADLPAIKHLNEQRYVFVVDWHPKNDRVASGNIDGLIEIWDAQNGERIITLEEREDSVKSLKWSPDGSLLASSYAQTGTVRIWNADTGAAILVMKEISRPLWILLLDWKPDGKEIAVRVLQEDGGKIKIFDALTGIEKLSWGNKYETSALKWSPDGSFLVSGGGIGGVIRLWDVATGQLVQTFDGDSYVADMLAWSPDSMLLASNGHDQKIRIWDVKSGEQIAEFSGAVRSEAFHGNTLAWSPDGDKLAATSDDGKIYVWDSKTYEVVAVYTGYKSLIPSG